MIKSKIKPLYCPDCGLKLIWEDYDYSWGAYCVRCEHQKWVKKIEV